MKRSITILTLLLFLVTTLQIGVFATTAIKVFVDGKELNADQSPIIVDGRTLVPLRAIFEALDAQVVWNSTTKTVVATKGDVTISLQEDSKTAKINNISITLDVAAKTVNGRVMVPGRFVSEALGAQVSWDSTTQRVYIITKKDVQSATNVSARDVSDYGDGRDLEVTVTKSANETYVSHYRVLVVRTENAHLFDVGSAQAVPSTNYHIIFKTGNNIHTVLNNQSRDVEGALIKDDVAYTVFVLTVGNEKVGNKSVLSAPSQPVVLTNYAPASPATSVKVSDISDYGDGRDLQVSFTKAKEEHKVDYYRIMVVKTKDANQFNLNRANQVPIEHSILVAKTGSNSTTTLGSLAKDVNGDQIKNGISYTVFVLSVRNHFDPQLNSLSEKSAAITLKDNAKVAAPTNVKVSDVSDHGDGRDLRVTFNKSSEESIVNHYRVLVVKAASAANFNVATANAIPSSNYMVVNKTGNNLSINLSSGARDVDGVLIRNGVAYKVFVLSVANNGNTNALSQGSATITLSNNSVIAVTNIAARDVNDFGDGRDLEVSFTKSTDEGKIGHYRVMVVPSNVANNFNLSAANKVATENYTKVNKTGSNLKLTLAADAKDVVGDRIAGGVPYKVFVLSVADGTNATINALSAASSTITLSDPSVSVVTHLRIEDVGNNGNGSDLQVSFRKANNESNISSYAIMVVKTANAYNFNLQAANAVLSANYTTVTKTGSNIKVTLSDSALDVEGHAIRNDVSYTVFVLSIADGINATVNSLSSASTSLILQSR